MSELETERERIAAAGKMGGYIQVLPYSWDMMVTGCSLMKNINDYNR
jgi:hypothetical protein